MSALSEFFKQGNRVYVAGFATPMGGERLSTYAHEYDSRLVFIPEFITIGTLFGGKADTSGDLGGVVTPGEAYCGLDINPTDSIKLYARDGVPVVARVRRREQTGRSVREIVIAHCSDTELFNRLSRKGRSANPGYEYPRLYAIDMSLRKALADFHKLTPVDSSDENLRYKVR